jgi:hypothetical protein
VLCDPMHSTCATSTVIFQTCMSSRDLPIIRAMQAMWCAALQLREGLLDLYPEQLLFVVTLSGGWLRSLRAGSQCGNLLCC